MTSASTLRHSIGTKIFAAFLAMSVIIAGVGIYAHYVLSMSGDIVADTYDKPMMAINFARAASIDFLQMQNAVLRARSLSGAEHAAASKQIDALAGTLSDDLDVAEERSTADDERKGQKRRPRRKRRCLCSLRPNLRRRSAMSSRCGLSR